MTAQPSPHCSCCSWPDPKDKVALTQAQIKNAQNALNDRQAELAEAIAGSASPERIQPIRSTVEYIEKLIGKLQSRLQDLQDNGKALEA